MNQTSFFTSAGDIDPMVARRAAAQACLDHANRAVEDWGDRAYACLVAFAKSHERVFAEDCTQAAHDAGLPIPPDARSWGWLYTRAQREHILLDDGMTRRRRNGSKAAVYRSLVA